MRAQRTRSGRAGNPPATGRVGTVVKAIRIERTGGPEVLESVTIERPSAGPGEVLIRQTAAGINYFDVYVRLGTYPRELPIVPGREGVGVVEAVGPDVSGFAPGMRVGYAESPNNGAYAEYNVVPARYCVEIPAGIDDAHACGAMLQALTAQYLATDSHAIGTGDRVLIHAAAGGVGRLLVQFAKRAGATVIATAGGAAKIALARSAGADHAIDYLAEDFEPAVKRITGGAGLDAVYDSVGKDTWERSLRLLRPRGSFVLYGASSDRCRRSIRCVSRPRDPCSSAVPRSVISCGRTANWRNARATCSMRSTTARSKFASPRNTRSPRPPKHTATSKHARRLESRS